MKKITSFIAAMLASVVLAGGAQAYPMAITDWTLDLSSYGLSTYNMINSITAAGKGTVTQQLGADHILSVGDQFTEFSTLFMLTTNTVNGDAIDLIKNGVTQAYLYANNLSGYVSDVKPTGEFRYQFTSGDMKLFVGSTTTANTSPGSGTLVSTFSLLQPSTGIASPGFLTNPDANGTSDLFGMISGATGIWKTKDGYDFGNGGTVVVHTTNNLLKNTNGTPQIVYHLDPTGAPDYFTANIKSTGDLTAAVPEPGTFALLGAGLFGLVIVAKRRKNS